MYNKYIGNTGKFIRVEDHPGGHAHQGQRGALPPVHQTSPPIQKSIVHEPTVHEPLHPKEPPSHSAATKNKPLLGGLGGLSGLLGGHGGGLGGLLGGRSGGSGGLLGGLGGGMKGLTSMFDHLPFGLDIGDILLFLLLLFLFLESGDEEFIIILGVIAFSLFKER